MCTSVFLISSLAGQILAQNAAQWVEADCPKTPMNWQTIPAPASVLDVQDVLE